MEGLSAADRLGAYVGLGSTYRVLGRYADAEKTLRQGLHEFPGNASLTAFLALGLPAPKAIMPAAMGFPRACSAA